MFFNQHHSQRAKHKKLPGEEDTEGFMYWLTSEGEITQSLNLWNKLGLESRV